MQDEQKHCKLQDRYYEDFLNECATITFTHNILLHWSVV